MASALRCITDWPERAQKAHYKVGSLAKGCGATPRSVERCFREKGLSPKSWLKTVRLQQSLSLFDGTMSIKQIAAGAGYTNANNYSRDFKLVFGVPPSSAHLVVSLQNKYLQTMSAHPS